MQIKKLHGWNLSYPQAKLLQKKLAAEVKLTPLKKQPELLAGLDCALSKDGQRIIASAVVLRTLKVQKRLWKPPTMPGFEIIETTNAISEVSFPYIPGLLSFREAPVCIAAVEKLKTQPDIFLIDGQGIAHPRRLGLAAHLGLFFDTPTIGCAKSRLTGTFEEPPLEKGSYTLLNDKKSVEQDTQYAARNLVLSKAEGTQYETIGAVVRTRTNVKPLFVSVGNKCVLEDAIKITLACATKYRLPEPTRLAHKIVSKLKLKT